MSTTYGWQGYGALLVAGGLVAARNTAARIYAVDTFEGTAGEHEMCGRTGSARPSGSAWRVALLNGVRCTRATGASRGAACSVCNGSHSSCPTMHRMHPHAFDATHASPWAH